MSRLTKGQANGVVRIVEAELSGMPIESLFHGAGKICNRSTFYRDGGWHDHPVFVETLERARQEARAQQLSSAVNETIEQLKRSAPLAARDLHRQIAGDERAIQALAGVALDESCLPPERLEAVRSLARIASIQATEVLVSVLAQADNEIRLSVLEALGSAGIGADVQRRMAAIAVLDRADRKTASKSDDRPSEELPDEELERIAAGGRREGMSG